MVDFHSHILWEVDDGSKSIEESKKMIEEAKNVGFDAIISTSHYKENRFEIEEKKRLEKLNQLKKECNMQLHLGNEVYATENIFELLQEKKASFINNSRYILVEFSLHTYSEIPKDFIFRLIEKDYFPIIAHPERYLYVQKHPECIEELKNIGALFQSNYGSILGIYGNEAKKTVKKLLKQDLISFLGSDVHHEDTLYKLVPKAIKRINKIVSDEDLELLTTINAKKVLNNEEIKGNM